MQAADNYYPSGFESNEQMFPTYDRLSVSLN